MTSATADTNIYISAFEFGGKPRRFIDLAAAREFRLDVSEIILAEILRVLRTKFWWGKEELHSVEEDIRGYANFVTCGRALHVIEADPSDNRILECASTAQSNYIVSGDTRHVLPIGKYEGIRIVTVAAFLELLGQGLLQTPGQE